MFLQTFFYVLLVLCIKERKRKFEETFHRRLNLTKSIALTLVEIRILEVVTLKQ